MMRKSFLISTIITVLIFTNGCATTLGNRSDINTVHFEIGKATKRDVAQTLGFPAMRVLDRRTEWWGYKKGSVFETLYWDFYSSVLSEHILDAQFASASYVSPDMTNMRSTSAVVYGFDNNGILTDTIKPISKSSR